MNIKIRKVLTYFNETAFHKTTCQDVASFLGGFFLSPRRVCKADVSTFALISAPISGSIWIGEICLSSSHLPPPPLAFVIISSVRSKTPRCLSPSRQCIKCHPLSNNRILFVFINTPINCSNCEAGQAGRQTARWCLICCCGLVCMCASSCAYLTHTPPHTHTRTNSNTPTPLHLLLCSCYCCIHAVMTFTQNSVVVAWIEAARVQCLWDLQQCWVISLCVCTPLILPPSKHTVHTHTHTHTHNKLLLSPPSVHNS